MLWRAAREALGGAGLLLVEEAEAADGESAAGPAAKQVTSAVQRASPEVRVAA